MGDGGNSAGAVDEDNTTAPQPSNINPFPESSNKYTFTDDIFSKNIPVLSAVLSGYAGYPLHMLEIGCHEGMSAVWMLENVLKHPGSRLTCVDPFVDMDEGTTEMPNTLQLFKRNALVNFVEKVDLHVDYSSTVLKKFALANQMFDIVYVDGDHHAVNVLEDAILAFRLLKVNGIMIFDDYMGGGQDMYKAKHPHMGVTAFMTLYGPYLNLIVAGYQLIVQKSALGRK
jgi:predicted O-methyltransferase YrrM